MPRPLNEMTTLEMWREYNALVFVAQSFGFRRFRTRPTPWRCSREYAESRLSRIRSVTGGLEIDPVAQEVNRAVQAQVQTFGVEFEFLMPVGASAEVLANLLTDAGVPTRTEMYGHTTRNHWKIVTDGSLGDYTRGRELVSPVLRGEAGFTAIRKACEVLTAFGAKITRHCGFHVHIGARNQPLSFFQNLLRAYREYEEAIDSFMAPSRRGTANSYCGPVQWAESNTTVLNTIDSLVRYGNGATRYKKLNLQSFWRHGTVEFRHHQGTVDARKAEMWVRFCLKMATAAAAGQLTGNLMTAINASEDEVRYFDSRRAYFARRDDRRIAA